MIEPNIEGNVLDPEIAKLYIEDKEAFEEKA